MIILKMLPTEICKKIFMYCDGEFYDNILKSNDTILINYLTDLGLHKVIEHYHNGSNNFCMIQHKNVCEWVTKFYIKRYTFGNSPKPHEFASITKYIPFNEKHFEFKCRQSNKICDETTAELFYKSDFDVHTSIAKKLYFSYLFQSDCETDDSDKTTTEIINKIYYDVTSELPPLPSQILYFFALHPEEHQPSGTGISWSRYDTCSLCSYYDKTKKNNE